MEGDTSLHVVEMNAWLLQHRDTLHVQLLSRSFKIPFAGSHTGHLHVFAWVLRCHEQESWTQGHRWLPRAKLWHHMWSQQVTAERILPLIMPLLAEEGLSFDQSGPTACSRSVRFMAGAVICSCVTVQGGKPS